MPTLLATLEKQNEDADEDDWNLSQSAAVCIQQMAITTEVSRRWGDREREGGVYMASFRSKSLTCFFQL